MPPLERRAPEPQWTYWRSLAELAGDPEFQAALEAEFRSPFDPSGISRRRWLQLMGASVALAGAVGCRWKKNEILPMASQPANRLPGQYQRFATVRDVAGSAIGLLVTSIDGRPIKIEGNPKHPLSLGATDAWTQASILGLYDPDRSGSVVQRSGGVEIELTWPRFLEHLRPELAQLAKTQGAGFAVLAESSSSPTRLALRAQFLKTYAQARWYEYEPISRDNEREGAKLVFGQPVRTHLALDKARVIVCLDADPLGTHPAAVRYARDFSRGRDPAAGPMNRLYAIEPAFTITGSSADHRLPVRSSDVPWFAKALHAMLKCGSVGHVSNVPMPQGHVGNVPHAGALIEAIAKDLKANGANTAVVAGPRQPPEVHALVHEINASLGNVGTAVSYTTDPEPDRPSHTESIRALCGEMNDGKVRVLVILGGNPVYDAPADLGFAEAIQKVPDRIHLSDCDDETSRKCTWHLPQSHYLESWGDARAYDGTYSVAQPLIAPLYDSRSSIELLAILVAQEKTGARDLVRETFQRLAGPDWEAKWDVAIESGLLADSAWPKIAPKLAAGRVSNMPPDVARNTVPTETGSGRSPNLRDGRHIDDASHDLEIVFCADASVYDGRFANSSWLQEMPDPVTKLTWDNAALVSPATAAALRVEHGTLVKLACGNRQVTIPAFVQPGQAPGSIAVALGYGRTAAGKVGGDTRRQIAPVGVDVNPLRTSGAMWAAAGATLSPTGTKYALATTQDHFAIDTAGMEARGQRVEALVREFTAEQYREKSKQDPHFARHAEHLPKLESLWDEHAYDGRRWGLVVDLSKCIGCGACVVACQAENNIPVVGKDRVLQGREMHWIRVDRYYRGEVDNPRVAQQVVACQHCENAPCEQVCPVAATVHSNEGLNEMVYNRCVGTRYCANNCPYKVRRFNFFNYRKDLEDPDNEVLKMVYNPEVTVRSRGVMEKCTYCVQRIQAAKIEAKNRREPIRDGSIQTACQQVCPAQAIVFGDLGAKDEQGRPSLVARLRQSDRAYEILAELNVKPRTSYLARIANPNPELESPSKREVG